MVAHGLNFMDDYTMWLNFRNGHMQLKAMRLKVGMKRTLGKEDPEGLYMFTLVSLVFFLLF